MNFITSFCTDAGAIKRINQDSLMIKSASFRSSDIIMASVCDGLGGLNDGETASAFVISELSVWFETELPVLLKKNSSVLDIRSALDESLRKINSCINRYSEITGKMLGTTMTTLLCLSYAGKIITAHIGDTRLYKITEKSLTIVTNDHSVISEEIRKGNITEEDAASDPRQNQLTKCMGAGLESSSFDYSIIPAEKDCTYMLCSDGFRKKLSSEELKKALKPSEITDDSQSGKILRNLTDLCIKRNENDNITSLILKLNEESVKISC